MFFLIIDRDFSETKISHLSCAVHISTVYPDTSLLFIGKSHPIFIYIFNMSFFLYMTSMRIDVHLTRHTGCFKNTFTNFGGGFSIPKQEKRNGTYMFANADQFHDLHFVCRQFFLFLSMGQPRTIGFIVDITDE
jgi:hypothetical protein